MVRNERGYALILVLFMIIIFMVLGTAVLSASIGGATRTETREDDIQSLHLADKTLNEAVAYLVSQFDEREDISPDELKLKMSQTALNDMKSKMKTNTDLANASAEITDITLKQPTCVTNCTVVLTAEATVNTTKRTLRQEVSIHSFPEFLKYAFGSENNVILNGGVQGMGGSVYAGKELLINNYARYIYKSSPEVRSYRSIYPQLGLDEEDKIYVQSLDSIKYDIGGTYLKFMNNKGIDELLGDEVTNDKIQLRNKKKFVSINVDETFLDKTTEAVGEDKRSAIKNAIENRNFHSFELALGPIATMLPPPVEPKDFSNIVDIENYELAKDAYANQFIDMRDSTLHNGDLDVNGIDLKKITYAGDENTRQGKWLIVNGDLNIVNENPDDSKIVISANMLVTGDVTIRGKVDVDAAIYTLGRTTIEDATIRGLSNGSGGRKQLIMISKGEILINRVDALENDRGNYSEDGKNTLDAFFYTDASGELYGVGSIFWLHGGFFAKGDLTINAVRGDVGDDSSDFVFGLQDKSKVPRFVIDYYDQFYEYQYSGLPRVKQLSVEAGARRLVPN
ncbi:hypothetical protein [Paenibacillus sp. SN-8-1]|uniref:hypothetical protein n=1 Tax=Paenibacillus sp. SN-8-1 TaxID=3435409 RepID=UPI003D9A0D2F